MKPFGISIVLIFLFINFLHVRSTPLSENVTRVLNDLLKKPYDKRIRPLLGENALFVRVSFNLDSFLGVNEQNSEISVRFTLRQNWLEPRLTFPSGVVPNDTIQLGPEQTKFLWVPDTVIGNQRRLETLEGHESTFLNFEGLISTSVKLSLTFDCEMIYDYFPFDTQTCSINFLSHTHERRDIIYEWMTEDSMIHGGDGPLRAGRFSLISFDMKTFTTSTKQGNSILLVLRLHLEGLWQNHYMRIFLPIMVFTGISLATLWFNFETAKIGIYINFLNVALFNIYLVGITGHKIRHTALGQYLIISFFFMALSLIVHFLKFYFETHPKVVILKKEDDEEDEEDAVNSGICSSPDEVEKNIELRNASSWEGEPPRRKSAASQRDMPPPEYIVYIQKFRLGILGFTSQAYWLLMIGFLITNAFYFGLNINSHQSRVEELLRSIRS